MAEREDERMRGKEGREGIIAKKERERDVGGLTLSGRD